MFKTNQPCLFKKKKNRSEQLDRFWCIVHNYKILIFNIFYGHVKFIGTTSSKFYKSITILPRIKLYIVTVWGGSDICLYP